MLNFYEWVNATGYSKELSYQNQKYFAGMDKSGSGTQIAQTIQDTATSDPLVITAPNHLRIPMMNPYVLDWGNHLVLPSTISDPDINAQLGYTHSMFRHKYFEINTDHVSNKELVSNLSLRNDNPLYTRYRDNVQEFKEVLETIATGPFKNYPFGKQLANWLCDTFMAITKDPNNERFTNMGFFAIAMSNGATVDLNKIKALISKLNPTRDGVPQDINVAKQYIENSELFKELSRTNKYFALSSTLNQFWNKSDQSRSELYTNPNSKYLTYLKNIADNRNTISRDADVQFMHSITDMYYRCANTADINKYITQKDEQRLLQVCNRYFTSSNIPLSR